MRIKRMRFMTRREWVQKHYPALVNVQYAGGVRGCLNKYPFTDGESDMEKCVSMKAFTKDKCEKCYDKPAIIDGKYILVRKAR